MTESSRGDKGVDNRSVFGAEQTSPLNESRRSVSRVGGSAESVLPLEPRLRFDPSTSSTSKTMNEAMATQTIVTVAPQAVAFHRVIADIRATRALVVCHVKIC